MISRFHPIFLSAVVFLFALAVGGAFINLAERRRSDEHRQALREIGTAQAHLLERQLDRSLSSTFALASILRQSGRIDNFDALAAEMIRSYGGISSLQLAPNGVVTQIYPLAGNEAAVGHDLLKDPQRRTEARAAIESRKLTLAGPFKLIQGGEAVIGRLPVFIPDEAGDERFWGFTIALIGMPILLEASKLMQLVEYDYDYELSRIDPDSSARVVFARSTEVDLKNLIPFQIEVPNGRWTLAIAPRGGWQPSSSLTWEIALILLVSMLVAVLTYSITRRPEILRREVELRTHELVETNRELEAQIMQRKRTEEALQHLGGRLINAHEEERSRLARELHDDLTQRLAVLAIEAGKLEQQLHSSPDLIQEKLQGMKEHIVELSTDIHRIARQLHPSILDDLGLVDAIKSECSRFSELEGIPVKFTADGLPRLPKDVSLCLYRVTQEGLRNIAKHAQTKEARVILASNDGNVFLSIRDTGIGFDPVQVQRRPSLGLASMEERVRLIQGSLSVHSEPGQGTVIEVRAPLAGKDV